MNFKHDILFETSFLSRVGILWLIATRFPFLATAVLSLKFEKERKDKENFFEKIFGPDWTIFNLRFIFSALSCLSLTIFNYGRLSIWMSFYKSTVTLH